MPEINPQTQFQIDKISEDCKGIKPLVVINCITFNHELYIRDALDGFVMQETNFPFVAIVHDDASTDGTAAIIREYENKFPNIIKPIYESENQYSKKNGTLSIIMHEAALKTRAEYIALCEGDDYWTDPLKLQKQVDFMKTRADYSMCITNFAQLKSNQLAIKKNPYYFHKNYSCKDIILGGGSICATCSILVRSDVVEKYSEMFRPFSCGDYPLQIFASTMGNIHKLSSVTCVYRYQSMGSWTSENDNDDMRLKNELSLINGLNIWLKEEFVTLFYRRKKLALFNFYAQNSPKKATRIFYSNLFDIIRYSSFKLILNIHLRLLKSCLRIF